MKIKRIIPSVVVNNYGKMMNTKKQGIYIWTDNYSIVSSIQEIKSFREASEKNSELMIKIQSFFQEKRGESKDIEEKEDFVLDFYKRVEWQSFPFSEVLYLFHQKNKPLKFYSSFLEWRQMIAFYYTCYDFVILSYYVKWKPEKWS